VKRGISRKKLPLYNSIVYCYMVQKGWTVLTGWSTVSGFDLAWFSCLSSEHLCVFGLHGAVYIVKSFCLHPFLYLLVSWALWIDPWPGWLTIILQCCETVGWVMWTVKSSPTYNVSSGTLNPTIRIMMVMSHCVCSSVVFNSCCCWHICCWLQCAGLPRPWMSQKFLLLNTFVPP